MHCRLPALLPPSPVRAHLPAEPFHYYVIQLEEFKGHVGRLKAAMEAAKPNDDQQCTIPPMRSLATTAGLCSVNGVWGRDRAQQERA